MVGQTVQNHLETEDVNLTGNATFTHIIVSNETRFFWITVVLQISDREGHRETWKSRLWKIASETGVLQPRAAVSYQILLRSKEGFFTQPSKGMPLTLQLLNLRTKNSDNEACGGLHLQSQHWGGRGWWILVSLGPAWAT